MSEQRDFNHIGEDIRGALDEALRSMDFTKLNSAISDTVNGALDEVRLQLDKAASDFLGNAGNRNQESRRTTASEQKNRAPKSYRVEYYQDKKKIPREIKCQERNLPAVKQRPVGQVSSVLYTVFGGVGTGVTGILSIIFGLMALLSGGAIGLVGFSVSAGILAVSLGLIGTGSVQRNRLNRFKRYMKLCGNKTYCDIKQLAAHVGRSSKYVLKDLKKMLQKGMLPEGHLDDKGTCLMLDDKTYEQYLETKQSYGARAFTKESMQTAKDDAGDAGENAQNPENQALDMMVAEGQEYIRKLRALNDEIPGEVISDKLYRLERVLTEIFDALREHPEKKPQMRKFMDYYLPTTLKLVQTYAEFDSVQIQGENITTAKKELEKTLDTINTAFEKLLDDLFRDAAFDATTDAQVLQTLLAQEGLAEDEKFKSAGMSGLGHNGGEKNEQ